MSKFLIFIIKAYQIGLSPYLGQQCRFTPTCSHYAIAAIQKHGALKGLTYAIWRILRCNPWQAGGHDPVP